MKKSNIFFIITAIFIIITIGCFFYKNSSYQEYDNYMGEHMAEDIALKNGRITQSEYSAIQSRKDHLLKTSDNANIIFYVSGGITIILLATSVVLKVKENKKK